MMKKFFVLLMILLSIFSISAQEKKITVLLAGSTTDPCILYATEKFKVDYPDVTVEVISADISTGSTITIDALLASGRAPNIYYDTLVRSSKFIVPAYALPLDGYIRGMDKFLPGVLDPFKRDGKTLALPLPGAPQGMCINLDIMEEIGFVVKDDWTIDDFLTMAKMVKMYYGGKKWATGMFAANQSGDYLINNWFASFGAKFYKPGDYSRTTIRETGGQKAYEFFQTLVRQGYVPSKCAMLTDDDYAASWAKGDLAATAFFPGWTDMYFKTAIEQGIIEKPFKYKFVPFPRAKGVTKVPTYMMYAAVVVHKTGTIQDTWAARFIEYMTDAEYQSRTTLSGCIPNRSDAQIRKDDPYVTQVGKIMQTQGLFDVGLTMSKFPAVRPQHFPILQKVLNLTITPEAAILEYERKINQALK